MVQDLPQTNTFVGDPQRARRALLEVEDFQEKNFFEEGEDKKESDQEEGQDAEESTHSHSPTLSAEDSDYSF